MWTRFMDMHSGGDTKEPPYEYILIEAPEAEARVIFYNRFGHNPERVTCTCCGEDYSIGEHKSLEDATAHDRGCAYVYVLPDGTEKGHDYWATLDFAGRRDINGKYVERESEDSWRTYRTLAEYIEDESVLVIRADEIKPSERSGSIPQQGYVWVD